MTPQRRLIAVLLAAGSLAAASSVPVQAGPERGYLTTEVHIEADYEHGLIPRTVSPMPGESLRSFDERINRPELSLEEALAEQRRNLKTYDYFPPADTDASRSGFAPLAYLGEDWITKDQCADQWEQPGFRGPWHYKNHYSACQRFWFEVLNKKCTTSGSCATIGKTKARAVIIGKGLSPSSEY